MADHSAIEWTTSTWNPLAGCTAVSPGCDHCYAARESSGRLSHLPLYKGLATKGVFSGEVRLVPERLDQPLRWRKPRRIFVNSMSDLFHENVPVDYIERVFRVMVTAKQHVFQVLTKRPARMRALLRTERFDDLVGAPNVWLGVSVEDQKWADIRIPALLSTPAAVRWLSCEPLLGSVNLRDCDGLDAVDYLDWVVAGGESGPGARPMHPDWPRSLQEQCARAEVPFFFKQWGEWAPPDHFDCIGYDDVAMGESGLTLWPDGRTVAGVAGTCVDGSAGVWRVGKKRAGRRLDGRTWDEYPVVTS